MLYYQQGLSFLNLKHPLGFSVVYYSEEPHNYDILATSNKNAVSSGPRPEHIDNLDPSMEKAELAEKRVSKLSDIVINYVLG